MALLHYVAAALLPALALALPQSNLNDIPNCAFPPLLSALSGTTCAQTDVACICAQQGIVPQITASVVAACPGEVTEADVTAFIAELCGGSAASSVASSASSSVAESVSTAASATTTTESSAASSTTGTTAANATGTGTHSTTNGTTSISAPTGVPTTVPSDGGAQGLRTSLMAAAVAFGVLTWAFAEL